MTRPLTLAQHSLSWLFLQYSGELLTQNIDFVLSVDDVESKANYSRCCIIFAKQPLMSYHIGDKLHQKAPHHESIKALWELKWKKPVELRPH